MRFPMIAQLLSVLILLQINYNWTRFNQENVLLYISIITFPLIFTYIGISNKGHVYKNKFILFGYLIYGFGGTDSNTTTMTTLIFLIVWLKYGDGMLWMIGSILLNILFVFMVQGNGCTSSSGVILILINTIFTLWLCAYIHIQNNAKNSGNVNNENDLLQKEIEKMRNIIDTKEQEIIMQNRYIACLTHDLRNMLLALSSNISLLNDLKTFDLDIVEDMDNCANLTKDMLNNALDMTKLKEGKLEFDLKMEDISVFANQLINLHRSKATDNDVTLNMELNSLIPPFICIDKIRLSQVVMNLINNAIKFTKCGTVVMKLKFIFFCEYVGAGDCHNCPNYIEQAKINKINEKKALRALLRSKSFDNGEYVKKEEDGLQTSGIEDELRQHVENSNYGESVAEVITDQKGISREDVELCNYLSIVNENAIVPDKHMNSYKFGMKTKFNKFQNKNPPSSQEMSKKGIANKEVVEERKIFSVSPPNPVGIYDPVLVKENKQLQSFGDYQNKMEEKKHQLPRSPFCTCGKSSNESQCDKTYMYQMDSKDLPRAGVCKSKCKCKCKEPHDCACESVPHKRREDIKRIDLSRLREAKLRESRNREIYIRRSNSMSNLLSAEHWDLKGSGIIAERRHCLNAEDMRTEGTLWIEVEDSGMGMTEEERDSLFQPFKQANKGVYGEHGGTGIGLWLSSQLVKSMGGELQCRSLKGVGTTFTVKIPTTSNIQVSNPKLEFIHTKQNNSINDSLLTKEIIPQSNNKKAVLKGMKVATLVQASNPIQRLLLNYGCDVVVCISVQDYLAYVKTNTEKNTTPLHALVIDEQYASFIGSSMNMNRGSLGVKLRQIVLLTNQSETELQSNELSNLFQLILKKPIKMSLLLHLLLHIKRGEELMSKSGKRLVFPSSTTSKPKFESGLSRLGSLTPNTPGLLSPFALTTKINEIVEKNVGIMIVDDNNFVRKTMTRICASLVPNIFEANSGAEALKIIEEKHEKIDLIFLDYDMPGMDGPDTAYHIRNYEKNPSLPLIYIIVLTGFSDEKSELKALSNGADLFLTKPISKEKIKKLMEDLVHIEH